VDPVVIANADGRLEVFVIGPDNRLWHKWQTGSPIIQLEVLGVRASENDQILLVLDLLELSQ
jgi:hypothetical protein